MIETLKKIGARLVLGGKWLVYNNGNWIVYEKKRYACESTELINTSNLDDALLVLNEE